MYTQWNVQVTTSFATVDSTVDLVAVDPVDLVAVDDSSAIDVAIDLPDVDPLELCREQQWTVQYQSDFVVMILCYYIWGG